MKKYILAFICILAVNTVNSQLTKRFKITNLSSKPIGVADIVSRSTDGDNGYYPQLHAHTLFAVYPNTQYVLYNSLDVRNRFPWGAIPISHVPIFGIITSSIDYDYTSNPQDVYTENPTLITPYAIGQVFYMIKCYDDTATIVIGEDPKTGNVFQQDMLSVNVVYFKQYYPSSVVPLIEEYNIVFTN